MFINWIETSYGTITLTYNDDFLVSLSFGKKDYPYEHKNNPFVTKQLNEYFGGLRKKFEFNFDFNSLTPFTSKVLYFIQSVPYGKTITYGEVAKVFRTSPRAIGVAMRNNPLPIFIPCHRVVAKNSIGGYTPSVTLKAKLLDLEHKNS